MAFTEIDEKLLVRAYQAGDERAFDTIVRTQYNALYAHALRRLSDHDSAEDAVQDTLLRAYRALPNLDGDLALRAWLHRILTNVCHDEGNRRRRQQGLVEKVGALPEELAGDPVEEAVLHDTVRIMSEALKDLPESYREALVLRYVDGLSFRDVAEATGTTEENARARVHRGRLALHKLMSRVAVMLAFVIPGLRRTQETTPTGAEQAVSSGMSEHTVSLATQLTTHAMSAAPTVSRFAEVASALPGGKSTLAAAAVTAVAAVSVPVAYTVNEVREPERPAPAVAAPAPESRTTTSTTISVSTGSTQVTTTTLPPSQADPFPEAEVTIAPVVPQPAPTTTSSTSTTIAKGEPGGVRLEGDVTSDDLQVTGETPQFDLAGPFTYGSKRSTLEGELTGRVFVRPDGTSDADDVMLVLEDGTELPLSYRGTVIAANQGEGEATYHITATYSMPGADDLGLAERGDLTIELKVTSEGTGTLLLSFSGFGERP
jgi:RNA polymerase sigma-70 factor (ECF subfamily)